MAKHTHGNKDLAERICSQAHKLGFDLAGIAAPQPPRRDLEFYRSWLERGDHGEMTYMARPDRVARREDPNLILPGVRSAVCVAVNYYSGPAATSKGDPLTGHISCYAWGEDYHDWMLPRLERLGEYICREMGKDIPRRAYVDTGPVLERALAARAGLGFVGKNSCLIHPGMGSWLFLGVLLLGLELPQTGPMQLDCGTCSRCLDACPTGALAEPYRVDARRCISYLTVELKGSIPLELRPLIGDWIYGCDICQQVCPWQRFARLSTVSAFLGASREWAEPSLEDLMALDEEGFRQRFGNSPVLRVGRGRLLRNAAVVLGNKGGPQVVELLRRSEKEADPLVGHHVAWALAELGA
jgi:epoxyqueuosine reductase